MALPRRCKNCKCFAAPWLKNCPRCDKPVPLAIIHTVPTKEEKQAARDKLDEGVPMLHAKNMQWLPSKFALASHTQLLDEAKRKLERAETPSERNAVRAEIRMAKQVLNKTADPKYAWTTEIFHAKQASIPIFISPKGRRYVSAPPDAKADLIIKNKKGAANPISRLELFDHSPYFKMVKAEAKQDAVHTKRKKVKAAHRKHTKQKHTLA